MGIVKAAKVLYEYIRRDEEGNVESITTALDHVSLDMEQGEFAAILGHNGSGKTTLAKHFNALLTPEEGTVWIGGKDTKQEEELWKLRQMAGMVFQNPDNQIVAGTVEEDVAFGPENMGVSSVQIEKRVTEGLAGTGMTDYRRRSPNKLSGGQKQRVAIAGVVAMRTNCIVFDEPTAMLDPVGRKEVLDTMSRLNKEHGITVILITHNMEEAAEADRVFVMKQGKVVLQGTPREVFRQREILESCRLELPQMTKLACELREAGLPIDTGILNRQELAEAISRLYG
ncbi:MAG: energy-coupling factor transporter ATPase [Eubacterium sp.]|nr:energy-coupling factor transporter ATPase [Eubacterium sp.]